MPSRQVIERDQHVEMIIDAQDGLHFAIVEIRGHVRPNEIRKAHRRSMFAQE